MRSQVGLLIIILIVILFYFNRDKWNDNAQQPIPEQVDTTQVIEQPVVVTTPVVYPDYRIFPYWNDAYYYPVGGYGRYGSYGDYRRYRHHAVPPRVSHPIPHAGRGGPPPHRGHPRPGPGPRGGRGHGRHR